MRMKVFLLCLVMVLMVPMVTFAARDSRRDSYRDSGDRFDERRGGVNFFGIIKSLDRAGLGIEISIDKHDQKVRLTKDTLIYTDRDRRGEFGSLHKGDRVVVVGYEGRNGDIFAARIHLGDDREWGRFDRSIEVKVVKDATFFSRKLKVEPLRRDYRMPDKFSLEIDRRAEITERTRKLSVQDIREGDILLANGHWDGTTFIAERIRVNDRGWYKGYDRSDYRSLTGRIERIYRDEQKMVVRSERESFVVYADRARVQWRDRSLGFDDLRKGDKVRISGDTGRDSVDAVRIEIID